MDLDDYLTTEFHVDKRDLSAVQRVIIEASQTLADTLVPGQGWPYRVRREGEDSPTKSHSTMTMVSLALTRLLTQTTRADLPQFSPFKLENAIKVTAAANAARDLLLTAIASGATAVTQSRTYGKNDPFTLSFLAQLSKAGLRTDKEKWDKVDTYLLNRVQELDQIASSKGLSDHAAFYKGKQKREVVSNAMIPLRIVQALRAVQMDSAWDTPYFRDYFEATLHEQLSYSSIPDSRFDPAELTFCLEGLLLSQANAVDRSLFQRVVEVLAKAQQENAFWRPVKPFMASTVGKALFPVSVEVANSLLRSCELFDRLDLHDTFGSQALPLFRRYWQWLKARMVRFRKADGTQVIGWHSEHVNEIGAIHVWETSQVIEFLLSFHRLLQTHVARRTLTLARFSLRPPQLMDGETPDWEDIRLKFEPVVYLGPAYEIYQRIEVDFIQGWREGNPRQFSMLLYGPPGTGKTTVAENIADALKYRLVTITVSDFLAGGDAQLEARAKAIFDVLESQPRCVVLFDEIDNFLLNRDSERYGEQETAFQFMTPGMLTKFNDLRRSKRVLSIIATNYENRIDPAIKRLGRIDKKYLVLPPDKAARKRMIQSDFLTEEESKQLKAEDWAQLEADSIFLGYKDIESAVLGARQNNKLDITELLVRLKKSGRTTRLETYEKRLGDTLDVEYPIEELLCLVGLALENNDEVPVSVVAAIKSHIPEAATIKSWVETNVPDLSRAMVNDIVKALE